MRTSPRNEKELLTRLEEQGLRCLIRKNDGGRIYGITFIDDTEGIASNGSRLGKGYSANRFEAYFADTTQNPFLDKQVYGDASEQTNKSAISSTQTESESFIEEVLDDMPNLDEFFSTGNDDWKEAAWQRKLRRQSKLRLRRRKR